MVEKEQLIAMVQGVQRGEDAAMAQMYETFQEDFYYFILKTVNNDRELAEDLVQDTFVEILETIHKLEEPAAFVTWAKQIAYHKCTGYFRKKKELLLDENEDGTSAFDIQVEENAEFIPDEALDNKELKQTIMNMINELPEDQRSALVLRYFNEVSVKEIAQIQAVSEGTVKSRLNYARKSIKQAVESYEKKSGIKLHCAGVLPLLLWVFREYRVANKLSMAAGTATQTFVLAEETAAVAGFAAAGSAAAGAATTTAATTATAATTTATTTAAAVAAKSAVAVGIKAAATALSTKIVAGVVAAAVVVGGTAAGITVAKKNNAPQPAPEEVIVQTVEETEAPTEALLAEETTEATEVTEPTEAPTEATEPTEAPAVCEHLWCCDHVRDDGVAIYLCSVCGASKEVDECSHSWTQKDWINPNTGNIDTIDVCAICGVYYSYASPPDEYYPEEEIQPTEPAACEHQWDVDNASEGRILYRCVLCDAVKDEVDPNYEPTEPPEEPTEPPTEAPTEAPTEPVCEAHNWELISEEPGVTIFECTYCGEQMSKYEENCTHPEYQTYEAELEDGTGKTITYWCTSCGSTYKETVYY